MGRKEEQRPRSRRARAWLLSSAAAIAAVVLIGLCVPGLSGRTRANLWEGGATEVAPAGRVLKIACLGEGRERLPREIELQAERLAKHLQSVGIGAIELVPVSSYERLRAGFEKDEIDVFLGSAFIGLRLHEETQAKILLERASVSKGDGQALWIVDAKTKADGLSYLRGQRVAFVDRFSTGRTLEAARVLTSIVPELEPANEDGSAPKSSKAVSFVISGDVESSLFWLRRGRVAAVALETLDVRDAEIGPGGSLNVIGRGDVAPRDVIVVRLGLDLPIAEALEDELSQEGALDPTGRLHFQTPSVELLGLDTARFQAWSKLEKSLAR